MDFKYSASGFRTDMENLFSRLTRPDPKSNEISLRFTRFCDDWKELNFSFVFGFRQNSRDLREFVDEIYLEVLPNVCSEYPLERRVCALYLLYSLFVKQPIICQKIRINFQYLEQIRELIQKCKQLSQLDVCYVWYKLLSLGAIDLVHVSRLMGPSYIRNSRVTNECLTETDAIIDEFRSSVYQPINELSHIHEKYRTIKDCLADNNQNITEECDLIEGNIFEMTKAKADNLHKQFFSNHIPDPSTGSDVEIESQELHVFNERETDSEDIGNKRRKLKEKALSFGNKSSEQMTQNKNQKKVKTTRGRPKLAKLTEIM